ncbi:hypothetical protein CHI14_08365 [Paenibacillus sp. 7516]|nr:hypothetical protein CHI14_08365 [Paenibacillus sp. 7516]
MPQMKQYGLAEVDVIYSKNVLTYRVLINAKNHRYKLYRWSHNQKIRSDNSNSKLKSISRWLLLPRIGATKLNTLNELLQLFIYQCTIGFL